MVPDLPEDRPPVPLGDDLARGLRDEAVIQTRDIAHLARGMVALASAQGVPLNVLGARVRELAGGK